LVRVLGVVDFVDGGLRDPKVICAPLDRDSGELSWSELDRFFRVYALFKRMLALARQRMKGVRGPDRGAETQFRGWLRHPIARPSTGAVRR
jgi:hypothetical protein